MPEFTAKDVQALRRQTGAGMMDAKRALESSGGDMEAAVQQLREQGLAKAAGREDRDAAQGALALATDGNRAAAVVELKSETDFAAKAGDFTTLAQDLAELVLAEGEGAVAQKQGAIDDLRIAKKENISLGAVHRLEAAEGSLLDAYLHSQDGRGTNAVVVEAAGVDQETAHEIALHVAFAKPSVLSRDDIPDDEVERERASLLEITKAEGKPEQAWDKIVDGRLKSWFAERVLLDQGIFGEKETVKDRLGDGQITRFVQVVVGG